MYTCSKCWNNVVVTMKCVLVLCSAFTGLFILKVADTLRDDMIEKDILLIRNHLSFNVSLFSMDPVQLTENDVRYFLFTRKHKNLTIKNTFNAINRKYPLKILVHGWTEHADVEWCMNTIKAYLRRGFYNIITVDWSSKGDTDYLSASRNSKPVGDKIGDFVIKLRKARNIPFRNIHLVSHSLGCHVAGFIGQRVFESTGEKVARITAMDPAAPLFDVNPAPHTRLSDDDAKLVDIIHTDGGVLGFRYSIGTVDFYPNGGSAIQPGCSLLKPDVKYDDFFCSHASSHQFFIKSISDRTLRATSCESWDKFSRGNCKDKRTVTFGEDMPANAKGTFYLQTQEADIIL